MVTSRCHKLRWLRPCEDVEPALFRDCLCPESGHDERYFDRRLGGWFAVQAATFMRHGTE